MPYDLMNSQRNVGGALQGLLGGVSDIVSSAQEAKEKEAERKRQEKLFKMGLLDKGLVETETGLDYTPEEKQRRTLAAQKEERAEKFQKVQAAEKGHVWDPETNDWKFDPDLYEKMMKLRASQDPLAQALKGEQLQTTRAKAPFERLPEEKQVQVKDISKSIGAVKTNMSILRPLLDVLKDPKLSPEEKISQVDLKVKALNSTMGADAAGVEEVNRLTGLLRTEPSLRYKKGFGADIPRFTQQLETHLNSLGSSIEMGNKQIDELYGRTAAQTNGLIGSPTSGRIVVTNGKETLEIDANDLPAAQAEGYKPKK